MTTAATEIRAQAWNELERLEGVKIRRPVRVDGRRPAGGEWDWYYALSRTERAYVSRYFMAPAPEGLEPEVLASMVDMGTDEAMGHWLACVRMTRRGGRIGSALSVEDEWGPICNDDSMAERVTVGDLVGPGEIGDRLGVRAATVHQWRWRGIMPEPITVLTSTPIWSWPDVEHWARETGRL